MVEELLDKLLATQCIVVELPELVRQPDVYAVNSLIDSNVGFGLAVASMSSLSLMANLMVVLMFVEKYNVSTAIHHARSIPLPLVSTTTMQQKLGAFQAIPTLNRLCLGLKVSMRLLAT